MRTTQTYTTLSSLHLTLLHPNLYIFHQLHIAQKRNGSQPLILVLSPTRELAQQIAVESELLCTYHQFSTVVIVGMPCGTYSTVQYCYVICVHHHPALCLVLFIDASVFETIRVNISSMCRRMKCYHRMLCDMYDVMLQSLMIFYMIRCSMT